MLFRSAVQDTRLLAWLRTLVLETLQWYVLDDLQTVRRLESHPFCEGTHDKLSSRTVVEGIRCHMTRFPSLSDTLLGLDQLIYVLVLACNALPSRNITTWYTGVLSHNLGVILSGCIRIDTHSLQKSLLTTSPLVDYYSGGRWIAHSTASTTGQALLLDRFYDMKSTGSMLPDSGSAACGPNTSTNSCP